MAEKLLKILESRYPLAVCDPGEFSTLKAGGMRFTVEAYEAQGLGHVSVMRAAGFFGLMKMESLIVHPRERDLPLYSYDRIHAMGSEVLLIELCNTTVSEFSAPELDAVLERCAAYPDRDPGVHWYDSLRLPQSVSKKGKKKDREAFDRIAREHLSAWLDAKCPPLTDRAAKAARDAAYVEGLLTHGGPSTDVMKKTLGQEKTEKLFRQVLFGTD